MDHGSANLLTVSSCGRSANYQNTPKKAIRGLNEIMKVYTLDDQK